jgi:hypothetical protein
MGGPVAVADNHVRQCEGLGAAKDAAEDLELLGLPHAVEMSQDNDIDEVG